MDYNQSRENMVVGQLTPNKIKNAEILSRFRAVAREMFVSQESKNIAYQDTEISIGYDREMFSPLTCATLVQSLDLSENDNVMILAAGTGYTATLIAPLVQQVVAIEENINFRDVARRSIKTHHVLNVEFLEGKPEDGCPMYKEFDKIIIDVPVEEIPQNLLKQLRDGGKIGAVIKKSENILTLTILTKQGNTLFEEGMLDVGGAVLKNFQAKEGFVF